MDESSIAPSIRDRTPFGDGVPDPLMDVSTFLGRLQDPDVRVVDARFDLSDPPAGRRAYRAGHVPGAVFLDLDEDLASAPARPGGRHPLPDMGRFTRTLGSRGVGDGHDVIVLDDVGTMYAARAWWLLRYAGHQAVWVLDGGYQAYLAAGGVLSTELPEHEPSSFSFSPNRGMIADADYVRRHIGDPRVLTIDARAPERYRGEVEPLDPKAGHVPGAINRYYEENLVGGRFAEPGRLRARFADALAYAEVVHYCGSGVSAAHNVLAMERAGLPGGRLYTGSWSDWCCHDELPVETGSGPG